MKRTISLVLFISIVITLLPTFVISAEIAFSDVNTSYWAYPYISEMVEKGYISGYEDGTFKPDNLVTREEFVKIKGLGDTRRTQDFADVLPSRWSYEYVMHSNSDGTDNNMFSPEKNISIEEVIVFLWKDAGNPNSNLNDTLKSSLGNQASDWSREAIFWAYENGIFMQTSSLPELGLKKDATRVETTVYTAKAKGIGGDIPYAKKPIAPIKPIPPATGEPYVEGEVVTSKERLLEILWQTANMLDYAHDSILITLSNEDVFISQRELEFVHLLSSIRDAEYTVLENGTIKATYIFYFGTFAQCYYAYLYDDTSRLSTGFEHTPSIKYTNKQVYDKAIEIVNSVITPNMNDFDKAVAIHDYLISNFKEKEYADIVSLDCLFDNIASFGDFTSAYELLMTLSGVACVQIMGDWHSYQRYSWNLIKIAGEWYHVDVTSDNDFEERNGTISYYYFLLSDDFLSIHGYKWDCDFYPSCSNDKYDLMIDKK